jgi:hypothetical protein
MEEKGKNWKGNRYKKNIKRNIDERISAKIEGSKNRKQRERKWKHKLNIRMKGRKVNDVGKRIDVSIKSALL